MEKAENDELDSLFKNLSEYLTEDNSHTDALIVDCLKEERFDLIKELCGIAILHKQNHHLLPEHETYRWKVSKLLRLKLPISEINNIKKTEP